MSKTLVNKYTKSDILLDFLSPLIFFFLEFFVVTFEACYLRKKKKVEHPFPPLLFSACVRACVRASFFLFIRPAFSLNLRPFVMLFFGVLFVKWIPCGSYPADWVWTPTVFAKKNGTRVWFSGSVVLREGDTLNRRAGISPSYPHCAQWCKRAYVISLGPRMHTYT